MNENVPNIVSYISRNFILHLTLDMDTKILDFDNFFGTRNNLLGRTQKRRSG